MWINVTSDSILWNFYYEKIFLYLRVSTSQYKLMQQNLIFAHDWINKQRKRSYASNVPGIFKSRNCTDTMYHHVYGKSSCMFDFKEAECKKQNPCRCKIHLFKIRHRYFAWRTSTKSAIRKSQRILVNFNLNFLELFCAANGAKHLPSLFLPNRVNFRINNINKC